MLAGTTNDGFPCNLCKKSALKTCENDIKPNYKTKTTFEFDLLDDENIYACRNFL